MKEFTRTASRCHPERTNWHPGRKDLHPEPERFHPDRGIKISHGPSFPSTHTNSYPLRAALQTDASADAYRMWKFTGFSSSKMYSLTFYSTINVFIVPKSRIFWMGSKIVSMLQELEGIVFYSTFSLFLRISQFIFQWAMTSLLK